MADVREGTLIGGKYLVEARVGEGAMGEVYRARNVDIDRIVAIKLLSDRHANDEIAVKRFLREAKNATLVRHPNVVDVIDLGQDDRGIPYMVQDFLSGEDLRSHLRKRGGRIPAADAIAIMRPIAHALAAAHAQGVVHRDVKPGNIFLANERGAVTPKLVDFGISRMASPDETATMTGTLVGTPAYMAPEQIHDPNRIGPATDVWAFGVVLFELVCGRRPFEEANVGALYVAISQAPVPRMDQLAFEAPRELADIVARCVERDLARRIPNGAELVAALDGPDLRAALSRPPPPELAGRHASGRMQAVRPSGEIALDLPIPGTPTVPVPAQQAAVPELDLPRRSRNDLRAVSAGSSNVEAAPASRPSGGHALGPPPSGPRSPAAAPQSSRMPASLPSMQASTSAFDSEPPPAPLQLEVERGSVSAPWRRAELHSQKPASGRHSVPGAPKRPAAPSGPSMGSTVAGVVVDAVLALGSLGALLRFVHRPSGISLKAMVPHAFDGTSAIAAGVVALVAVALTVAFFIAGLRAPRSWSLLFGGFGALLSAMVMIVVTFSTTPSDPPTPPESAFILPFVLPLVLLGLAAWAASFGFRRWRGGGGGRALLLPFALLSGALLFGAFEVSPASGVLGAF